MANKKSFFLTGANARILLNNKTVAFATDIQFTIDVKHVSPRVLGRFEVEVHQPLAMDIDGSLTIIRYARGMKGYLEGASPANVSDMGNGVGSMGAGSGGPGAGIANNLGLPLGDGAPEDSFNPGTMLQSKQFNIEIRQKVPVTQIGGGGGNALSDLLNAASDFVGGVFQAGNALLFGGPGLLDNVNPADDETTVILLRDCRITGMDFRLTKRGAAVQTLKFKARYYDDDTQISRGSGVGQELS